VADYCFAMGSKNFRGGEEKINCIFFTPDTAFIPLLSIVDRHEALILCVYQN
jgi:hypothetical protein